jgi:hypothetical protein
MMHGLHREVTVHIIGRDDDFSQTPITLKRLALLCLEPLEISTLERLEEIGLDLDDPELLYETLNIELVTYLHERCTRLDELMPNGQTLRTMLADFLNLV